MKEETSVLLVVSFIQAVQRSNMFDVTAKSLWQTHHGGLLPGRKIYINRTDGHYNFLNIIIFGTHLENFQKFLSAIIDADAVIE